MENKGKKYKLSVFVVLIIALALIGLSLYQIPWPHFSLGNFALLSPKGSIAQQQKNLIVGAVLLMLIIVIPVFILLFVILLKYKKGSNAQYSPDTESTPLTTALLWVLPAAIIFAVSILNWKSAHTLDPYKPIASNQKPITIQVVALQWKWLFIYPESNIATVNFVEFPENTPINFELTADAPMNSFWIPELGGQMYAMAGMSTQLHLIADKPGEFKGSAADISGKGFAGMRFIAKSTSQKDFDLWLQTVKLSEKILTMETYNELVKPSENNPKTVYSRVNENLYNNIMMKYMTPPPANQ